ncbi:hypothetical protein GCM10027286_28560 [Virgibacillus ainsalahensis]
MMVMFYRIRVMLTGSGGDVWRYSGDAHRFEVDVSLDSGDAHRLGGDVSKDSGDAHRLEGDVS